MRRAHQPLPQGSHTVPATMAATATATEPRICSLRLRSARSSAAHAAIVGAEPAAVGVPSPSPEASSFCSSIGTPSRGTPEAAVLGSGAYSGMAAPRAGNADARESAQ